MAKSQKERIKECRERWVLGGNCRMCGQPRGVGAFLCDKHTEWRRGYENKRRQKIKEQKDGK